MKGYKVFNSNWTCYNDFQYEVGKTYEMDDEPIICRQGFHFCTDLKDCFLFYPFDFNIKIAEVEALGNCDKSNNKYHNKYCTNKIKIVREIPVKDLELVVKLKVLNIVSLAEYNVGEIIDYSCEDIVYSDFPILKEGITVLSKSYFPHYCKVRAYVIVDVKIK